MMKHNNALLGKNLLLALLPLLLLGGCENFFGEKTDRDFIQVPDYDSSTVAYVPIQPAIDDFSAPVDIYAGFDNLLYVVDSAAQELIQLDQAARRIGTLEIPGVKAVAQDRRLHLLILGTVDTVIDTTQYTLDALYRYNPYGGEGQGYGLGKGKMLDTLVHPFVFGEDFTASDANVKFEDVDVLADNRYLVARNGPSVGSGGLSGPDDGIMQFSAQDEFEGPVIINNDRGSIRDYFNNPISITTRVKPPQGPFVSTSEQFYVGQASRSKTLRVENITTRVTEAGQEFVLNQELTRGDTTKANGFLYEAARFDYPAGLTYTGDGSNHLLVTDMQRDSVYLFTNTGLEGVKPPPASNAEKNINVSFGGTGNSPVTFQNPAAVAHRNDILYVADQGNGRILRFKLTTDFQ